VAALNERVKDAHDLLIEFKPRGLARWVPLVGCALVSFVFLFVFFAGVAAISEWFAPRYM
jgi:hypothetical protein